jgi:ribosomal protein S18 acetylase RimI-like enzyme
LVEMVHIRAMTEEDFDYALRLTNMLKWDYLRRDFEWMVEFEPEGCFVATEGGRRVGITTTITYQKIGWIGNVAVSPRYRRMGVGSALVERAVDYLRSRSVDFMGLYAYPEAAGFYNALGFRGDERFIRLRGQGRPYRFEGCRRMERRDLEDVMGLDAKCFGAGRGRVLKKIFEGSGGLCWVRASNGRIVGCVMGTESATGLEAGPWVCDPTHIEGAMDLLKAFLSNARGERVGLVVPARSPMLIDGLKGLGFEPDFTVLRMFYGGRKPRMEEGSMFAIESLERG